MRKTKIEHYVVSVITGNNSMSNQERPLWKYLTSNGVNENILIAHKCSSGQNQATSVLAVVDSLKQEKGKHK